jgi:isoaspartyl peptidase/L-asparaginase-like protein (Ntn-hydrolase superfamily)
VPGAGTWADEECAVSTSGGEALFRVALAHSIAMRSADGGSVRSAAKTSLVELRKLMPDGIAGAIVISKNSWSALQLGPTMPVEWVDDFGANDAIGFEL